MVVTDVMMEVVIEKDNSFDCCCGWLLSVSATGYYISGMDLLRQLYVLPH